MFFPQLPQVFVTVLTGDILMFITGTSLTWSSPEISKLTNGTDNPFGRDLSSEEITWISSLVTLGAFFGPFIFGFVSDRIGRKYTNLLLAIPYLISYLLMAFVKVVEVFYFARFLSGLAVGGSFTVMPVYVSEMASKTNRGTLSSTMSCAVCLGFMFSYCVGPYTSVQIFNVVLAIFPAIFFVLFFLVGIESPHYYLRSGKTEEARSVLQKIRGGIKTEDSEKELNEIQAKIDEEGQGKLLDLFKSKGLIKGFVIAVGLLVFQQLTGINAVLFYGQSIIDQTGSAISSELGAIIIGSVQFGSSLITPLIADRFGRKTILISSAIGMIVCDVPLGVYCYLNDHGTDLSSISFFPVLVLALFIICYNSGFGPLPWTVMSEVFPSNIRSIASSVVSSINWILAFVVTKYFNSLLDVLGLGQAFWIFAACCVVAGIFTKFYVVETKGKTLEEIQDILKEGKGMKQ